MLHVIDYSSCTAMGRSTMKILIHSYCWLLGGDRLGWDRLKTCHPFMLCLSSAWIDSFNIDDIASHGITIR